MGKVFLFIDLFRKGGVVADPTTWKNRGALVLALTGLLTASNSIAKSYGYDLGLSDADIAQLAVSIAIVVGLFITFATSDKVGILPAKETKSESSGTGESANNLQTELKFDPKAEADLRGGP